jgi:hypothetical protein
VEPGRGTFDRDIDSQPLRAGPEPTEPVADYQRLVANPLLGVLSWIAAFYLLRESVRRHNLVMFVWATAFALIGVSVMQFHCLDCGQTGWLIRSRAHACPAVVARRQLGWARQTRGPGLKIQLVMWFIVLTAALVLGLVALRSR